MVSSALPRTGICSVSRSNSCIGLNEASASGTDAANNGPAAVPTTSTHQCGPRSESESVAADGIELADDTTASRRRDGLAASRQPSSRPTEAEAVEDDSDETSGRWTELTSEAYSAASASSCRASSDRCMSGVVELGSGSSSSTGGLTVTSLVHVHVQRWEWKCRDSWARLRSSKAASEMHAAASTVSSCSRRRRHRQRRRSGVDESEVDAVGTRPSPSCPAALVGSSNDHSPSAPLSMHPAADKHQTAVQRNGSHLSAQTLRWKDEA